MFWAESRGTDLPITIRLYIAPPPIKAVVILIVMLLVINKPQMTTVRLGLIMEVVLVAHQPVANNNLKNIAQLIIID